MYFLHTHARLTGSASSPAGAVPSPPGSYPFRLRRREPLMRRATRQGPAWPAGLPLGPAVPGWKRRARLQKSTRSCQGFAGVHESRAPYGPSLCGTCGPSSKPRGSQAPLKKHAPPAFVRRKCLELGSGARERGPSKARL